MNTQNLLKKDLIALYEENGFTFNEAVTEIDFAIELLCGISPKDLDAKLQEEIIDRVINERKIKLCGIKDIDFNYKEDLVFSSEFLPLHENALTIKALDEKGDVLILKSE